MAGETGLSKSSVQRLWSAHKLQPHRVRDFKLSKDLQFEEKFWDVVGLYLDPPEQAVVLCSDEKCQCQALERTQPGLPLGQGHIRTRTHDYYRHGTVTLFAALDYLSGKVFAHTAPRHRHQEWLAFLRKIDKEVAPELELHIICDNYSTHKHAKVTAWLKRHPRFHLHFIPTSSSWLNLVERFFGEITAKVIRPGSFRSVGALVADIFRFLDHHNLNPKPYRWTADPTRILKTRSRMRGNARRNIQSCLWDVTLAALEVEVSLTNDVTSSFVFGRAKRSRLRKKLRNAIPARISDRFRPIFEKVQGELEVGARHTLKYGDNAEVRKGDLFILDGREGDRGRHGRSVW